MKVFVLTYCCFVFMFCGSLLAEESYYLPEQKPFTGELRVLAVLVKFPELETPDWGKERAENKIFSSEPTDKYPNDHSVNAYWKECSSGKMQLSGKCLENWVDMPKQYSEYEVGYYSDISVIKNILIDTIKVTDPYVDFTKYDEIIFVFTGTDKEWIYFVMDFPFDTDDGVAECSLAFVTEKELDLGEFTISGMIGSGLGLSDANSIVIPSEITKTQGDLWCSSGESFAQLDGYRKYFLGWLDKEKIKIISSSGDYWLEQRELDSGNDDGTKLIVIPIGYDDFGYGDYGYQYGYDYGKIFYTIEYFKELGEFDSNIFLESEPNSKKDTVLLRRFQTNFNNFFLYGRVHDSVVFIEETDNGIEPLDMESREFYDSEYGVSIQVLEKKGEGKDAKAKIRISLLNSPTPQPTPQPTIQPKPTPQPTPQPTIHPRTMSLKVKIRVEENEGDKIEVKVKVRVRNSRKKIIQADNIIISIEIPDGRILQRNENPEKSIFSVPKMLGKYRVTVTASKENYSEAVKIKTFKVK